MIGDVPIGDEDLVEMWFVVGRGLEVVHCGTHTGTHLTTDDAEEGALTRRRELPRNSW